MTTRLCRAWTAERDQVLPAQQALGQAHSQAGNGGPAGHHAAAGLVRQPVRYLWAARKTDHTTVRGAMTAAFAM